MMLAEVLSNLNATIQGQLKSPINMFQDTIILTNLLMDEIAADISAFRSALLSAELGKLHSELIKPEILKETLTTIEKNTPLSNIIYNPYLQID